MKTPQSNSVSKSFVPRAWRLASSALLAFLFLTAPSVHALEPRPSVDGNGIFTLDSGESVYYGYAPDIYDPGIPSSLFVWMHGCGGDGYWDVFAIAPAATRANQSYVAISIGGRDGACWDVNADAPKVLAAIADVSRYFNIDPKRIFLGGYSSGGDLTYRVGFENARRFAGLLVENSDPFRDTGSTGSALMAAAAWKINVAHLAHTEDAVYPIAGVRANLATLQSNGFPVYKIERPGNHWDNDAANSGTNYDLRTYLLPYLDAGWTGPGLGRPSLSSKKRVVSKRAKIVLRGRSQDADTVEFKVKGKKYRSVRGSVSNWRAPVRLDPGRNIVRVRASNGSGSSKSIRIVVKRVSPAST